MDLVFSALSDSTRRAILERLARGEATVGELSEPFRISAPAISRHLRVLERAKLIESVRVGQHRRCRLMAGELEPACDWLGAFRGLWVGDLDRLDTKLRVESLRGLEAGAVHSEADGVGVLKVKKSKGKKSKRKKDGHGKSKSGKG